MGLEGPQTVLSDLFTMNMYYLCAVLLVSCCVQLCVNLRTVAHQAPLSMGILQTRILEWVAMPSSRGSSQPRDRTQSPALQADSLPSEPPGMLRGQQS